MLCSVSLGGARRLPLSCAEQGTAAATANAISVATKRMFIELLAELPRNWGRSPSHCDSNALPARHTSRIGQRPQRAGVGIMGERGPSEPLNNVPPFALESF